MTDQPDFETPVFEDDPSPAPRPVRATPRSNPRVTPEPTTERKVGFFGTLDPFLLGVVGLLLAIGMMMVYSTTFDWSFVAFGSETAVFVTHIRNVLIAIGILLVLTVLDYRVWRRVAVILLLITIGTLIAVLLFGDNKFGARRALVNGSFQPGELAELVTVIYMAAWLSSRRTRIRSITYGLIPFLMLIMILAGLVVLQPDISTAVSIVIVAGIMFFLAGADLFQLAFLGVIVGVGGIIFITYFGPNYARDRVSSYVSGVGDVTQADYHVQQAIKAFNNGGWTGLGLGQGKQKFGYLPAPHTDSIFAVIGEELGILGASFVVLLYIILVMRGFQVARRSADNFGTLLAAGLIIWLAFKALLNIAVMLGRVPPTGAPLPFISYGGSSLVTVMAATGLLLSVARVRARQGLPKRAAPERSKVIATHDSRWGNRRQRLPRPGSSSGAD
jgi:cell division protein FtsW